MTKKRSKKTVWAPLTFERPKPSAVVESKTTKQSAKKDSRLPYDGMSRFHRTAADSWVIEDQHGNVFSERPWYALADIGFVDEDTRVSRIALIGTGMFVGVGTSPLGEVKDADPRVQTEGVEDSEEETDPLFSSNSLTDWCRRVLEELDLKKIEPMSSTQPSTIDPPNILSEMGVMFVDGAQTLILELAKWEWDPYSKNLILSGDLWKDETNFRQVSMMLQSNREEWVRNLEHTV